MKKIILSSIIIICFFITGKAQTTEEEYNYVTKGYKVQMESGLDMKKGYSLVDLGKWGMSHNPENRECTFKALMREGQSKPCAIMMIYRRTDISTGTTWYICIPTSDASASIWQKTLDFINTNFKQNDRMLDSIIWALMHFSAQEAAK